MTFSLKKNEYQCSDPSETIDLKKGMVLQTHNLTPFFRKLIVSTTWLKKLTYQPLRQCNHVCS